MHVLERERQRELGREVALGDPLQLGCLPGETSGPPSGRRPPSRCRDPTDEQGPPRRQTASDPKASHVLFTTFRREPAPTSPTQNGALTERVEERSDTRATSSGPDAKIVSLPCAAGSLLPDTGASRSVTSGRWSSTRAATRSIPATPIVLICAQIAPGASAASMPWSRAIEMTASASVTMVMTIAALRAASAAVSATSAPSSARSRVASRPAVPDNGRDAGAQSARRHPMAHRTNAKHCNRLVRRCHP